MKNTWMIFWLGDILIFHIQAKVTAMQIEAKQTFCLHRPIWYVYVRGRPNLQALFIS
jgi:hypothetical protein